MHEIINDSDVIAKTARQTSYENEILFPLDQIKLMRAFTHAAPEELPEFDSPGGNANFEEKVQDGDKFDDTEAAPSDEFDRKGIWLTLELPPLGYKPPTTVKEAMEDTGQHGEQLWTLNGKP